MNDSPVIFDVVDTQLHCDIKTAGFRNLMPSGVAVNIVKVQAKFTYTDGSSEMVGPRIVDIIAGGNDEVLMSSCNDKCASSIWGQMTVRDRQAGGDRTVVLEKTRLADGPNKCLLSGVFPLGKT